MDMDPITRREADKVEGVLNTLITELELVSFLPEEFNLWLRDDIVPTVEQSSELASLRRKCQKYFTESSTENESKKLNVMSSNLSNTNRQEHYNSNNDNIDNSNNAFHTDREGSHLECNDDRYSNEMDDTDSKESDELEFDEEEMEQMIKAMCFVHAASHYGDPADCINNEALIQVTDFNEVERELLETATTLGHIEGSKLQFHHVCTRALIDLLQNGEYDQEIKKLLTLRYPGGRVTSDMSKKSNNNNATLLLSLANNTTNTDNKRNNNSNTDNKRNNNNNNNNNININSHNWRAFRENSPLPSEQLVEAADSKTAAKSTSKRSKLQIEYNEEWARENNVINKSTSHLKKIIAILTRLIQLRNTFTVNEDVHRYKVLHEAIHKEQSTSADVQALNREYEEAKLLRQQEVSELDAEIENLEMELNEVQEEADHALDALNAAHEQVMNDKEAKFRAQINQHESETNNLAEQLKRVQGKHTEETNALRSMRAKKEAAVSGAISEYDTQMEHLHEVINSFQRDAENDSDKIVRVQGQLATLMSEKAEYELEKRVSAQRKEHDEMLARKLERDVRVIQAYYRAYLVRQTVEREMSKRAKKSKKRRASSKLKKKEK